MKILIFKILLNLEIIKNNHQELEGMNTIPYKSCNAFLDKLSKKSSINWRLIYNQITKKVS
jgi:hypothetical protein